MPYVCNDECESDTSELINGKCGSDANRSIDTIIRLKCLKMFQLDDS